MTTSSTGFARRIKQQLHAPVHDWFAPCALGFEGVLKQELAAIGAQDLDPLPGGVGFRGKLELGYQANLWLRSANRILLRAGVFRAKRPEDLFRHARQLPWELLLASSAPLRIQTTSFGSWLSHSDLIEQTLRDAIRRRFQEFLPDAAMPEQGVGAEQLLLLRIEDDQVTLSLDSSGEHLHRRGYRLASAMAPIRESLAAGILLAAGYDGSEPLLDPMSGSGTFSIEAALMASRMPPGLHRDFEFKRWPSFKEATWNHLLKRAREGVVSPGNPIMARDLHALALRAVPENAERAGVAQAIQIEQADFFAAPPPAAPGLVVLNPPYGKRVGEESSLARFYSQLGNRLRHAYAGWRFAMLVPEPWLVAELRLDFEQRIRLPHGGLKVELLIGRM